MQMPKDPSAIILEEKTERGRKRDGQTTGTDIHTKRVWVKAMHTNAQQVSDGGVRDEAKEAGEESTC